MENDYLKLAREARDAYLGDPTETCAGGKYVPALCDAIEALERERLTAIASAQKVGVEQWRNLRRIADATIIGDGYYTEEELADAIVAKIEAQAADVIELEGLLVNATQQLATHIEAYTALRHKSEAQTAEIERLRKVAADAKALAQNDLYGGGNAEDLMRQLIRSLANVD